jgi:hypothetical protein
MTEAKEITVNSDFRGQPDYIVYRMEPARRANPENRLDGAWIVCRIHVWDAIAFRSNKIVARFSTDGRDACERWAHRHGITFGVRMEVR